MEDQTRPATPPPGDAPQPDPQPAPLIRSLSSVTRQLPAAAAERRTQPESKVAREQITALIGALGDAHHPLHLQASQDLTAIGPQAVPALCEALSPRRPWLVAFRAAEALGQIGDGRATGALIEALHHPNSNVRWGAITALAAIGDATALLELRRMARDDRGKTSWGESVAGAAQSALDQMRSQNVLLRSTELLKTAIACVLMLVGLILAWSVITTVRTELGRVGLERGGTGEALPLVRTALPTRQPAPAAAPLPATTEPLPTSAAPLPAETGVLTGTVLTTGNVRNLPSREVGQRIGLVAVGDEVVFLAASPDLQWYRVRLGSRRVGGSQITSADGSGWVISTVLAPPSRVVPIEPVVLPTAAPPTTAPPTASP